MFTWGSATCAQSGPFHPGKFWRGLCSKHIGSVFCKQTPSLDAASATVAFPGEKKLCTVACGWANGGDAQRMPSRALSRSIGCRPAHTPSGWPPMPERTCAAVAFLRCRSSSGVGSSMNVGLVSADPNL